MKRRFLAVLLAGVLAFSNMGTVFAADVPGAGSTVAEESPAEEVTAEAAESEAPEEEPVQQDAGEMDPDIGPGDAAEAETPAADSEGSGSADGEAEEGTEQAGGDTQDEAEEPSEPESAEQEAYDEAREEAAEEADTDEPAQEEAEPQQEEAGAVEEAAEEAASKEAVLDENYDIWFEEHDVDLYTDADPIPELVLDMTNLSAGLRDRVDLELMVGEWDDESDDWAEMLGKGKYTVTDKGGRVRVTLSKAYLTSLTDYRNVRAVAELYPKGAERTEENRLRDTDAWFHIHYAREEYDREWDRTMLPGWDGTVDGSRNVYIENSEFPEGRDERYFVTDVQVVRDEPWEGEDGDVIIDFHRDENGEDDYWWYYRVGNRGEATLKVTYRDLQCGR